MKLRFTPRARLDLIGIADYIRTRNPAAALAVRQAILGSLQTVAMFPEIGRRQSVEGVRKLITRRYRYFMLWIARLRKSSSYPFSTQLGGANTRMSNLHEPPPDAGSRPPPPSARSCRQERRGA